MSGRHRCEREPAPYLRIRGVVIPQGRHALPLDKGMALIDGVYEQISDLPDLF